MFNAVQFRELIVKPTLLDLVLFTEDFLELLIFTCAVESNGGTYLKQMKGPALGIYQMQPDTYNDLWQNYIKKNLSLLMKLFSNFNLYQMPSEDKMIYDLRFATAMSAIFYTKINSPIPRKNDLDEVWNYYKKYYNTYEGQAEKESSLAKYKIFTKN